jgi:hypothetical protein
MIKKLFIPFILSIFLTLDSSGQVNLQSGSAVFDVPIYSFQDIKSRLSMPVSLTYNGGMGLRVDEVATDVGQGWGLMAGGKIIRVQIGEPDDQFPRGGEGTTENPQVTDKYPAGYLYTNANPVNGAPLNYSRYPVFPNPDTKFSNHNAMNADREADRFIINLNGINATFILKKDDFNKTTGEGQGVFLGNTLMKIKFFTVLTPTQSFTEAGVTSSARTTISKFELQDENGIVYTFEKKAYNRILRLAPSDRRFVNQLGSPKKYKKREVYHETFFPDASIQIPFIVTEWHLTKIHNKLLITQSPNNTIQLQYEYRHLQNQWIGFDYTTQNTKKDYGKVIAKKAVVLMPVLKAIACPNKYNLLIDYGDEQRFDVKDAKRLKQITVTYNNRIIQRHVLNHTYVIYTRYGTPVTNEQKLASRLYLIGITKYTADLKDFEKPYTFDYYLGGSSNVDFVPPPFFASKDIWGFYDGCLTITGGAANVGPDFKAYCVNGSRGDISTEFPSFDEIKRLSYKDAGLTRVKDTMARNGLLKFVHYPTGASLKYEYEQRKGKFINETIEQNICGVQVSKTTLYDGGYSNGCTTSGLVTRYSYKNADGSSSFWGAERPLNYYEAQSEYRAFDRKLKFNILLTKTKCEWGYQYPGIQYADQANKVNGFSALMSSAVAQNVSSGLSILSTISNVMTVTSVISNASKLSVIGAWIGIGLDILMAIFDAYIGVKTCTMDATKTNTTRIWYNRDLRASNPLPMMYKRIEVIAGDGSTGKTVHEFTSMDDYPVWVMNNPIASMQQRYGHWYYGLPKKIIMYDANGNRVKETINTYPVSQIDTCLIKTTFDGLCSKQKRSLGMFSCNINVTKAKPVKSINWGGYHIIGSDANYTKQSIAGEMDVNIYDHYTGHLELLKSEERTFPQGSNATMITKTTNYTYRGYNDMSIDNYLPIETEETVDGQASIKTIIKYNNDGFTQNYGSNHQAAMTRLSANNIKNVPIESIILVKRPYTGEAYKFAKISYSSFTVNPSGLVLPDSLYEKRVVNPVTDMSSTIVSPVMTSRTTYNNEGIPLLSIDESGRSIRYLYDYDDQFATAEVINAGENISQTISYTSFETNIDHGFSGNGIRVDGNAITGKKIYQLTSSTPLQATISNAGSVAYRLSFWSTQPVTVTNATLISSGPVRKGFTYYEYKINTGVSNIQISGTASIDEVRLLPQRARMNTTAYDPVIGKLTSCGPDSRFVAYEYDTRGRLNIIRDEFGAIVKKYEFGEKQKPNDCNSVYYSHAVFEVFKKTNCTAGYVGNYVEYSLPEGMFTSTISQEHADLLAENHINLNGQAFANSNGSCKQLFSNAYVQETFYKENCPVGQKGTAYVYAVTAGKYTSTLSLQDANDQALEEIADMGQVAANQFGGCTTDYSPQWVGNNESEKRCQNGITQVRLQNINPNSNDYLSWQWFDAEENINDCIPSGNENIVVKVNNNTVNGFLITFTRTSDNYSRTFNTVTDPVGPFGEVGYMPPGSYTITMSSLNYSYFNYAIGFTEWVTSYVGDGFGPAGYTIYNVQLLPESPLIYFEFN